MVTPPKMGRACWAITLRFLYKGKAKAMVAGPKRKLINSAPAAYCLYSTPGVQVKRAMMPTQAGTKGGSTRRPSLSTRISLKAYKITVRPMPKRGELSKLSGNIYFPPFLSIPCKKRAVEPKTAMLAATMVTKMGSHSARITSA